MSQETTTQLLGLPTEYGVPGEDGRAFSAAEVDWRSASRMLRVLMLFAWALAGAVLVSAFLSYGTDFSNLLAGGWFAVPHFVSGLAADEPVMAPRYRGGHPHVHRDQMVGVMALR